MDKAHWAAVDAYFGERLIGRDAALEGALAASAAGGLPEIQVSAAQGKMLMLLARLVGAKRVLEIGTLGGYSTIWLARGVAAGGRVITLEIQEKHAAVARENLKRAGVADRVEVRVGKALELLPEIEREGGEPFDLVFIDADKVNTTEYFQSALRLGRPGGLILVDNVARKGEVIDTASADVNVIGMRRFMDYLAGEKRVEATAVQTVGSKGYDGFVMAVVGEREMTSDE